MEANYWKLVIPSNCAVKQTRPVWVIFFIVSLSGQTDSHVVCISGNAIMSHFPGSFMCDATTDLPASVCVLITTDTCYSYVTCILLLLCWHSGVMLCNVVFPVYCTCPQLHNSSTRCDAYHVRPDSLLTLIVCIKPRWTILFLIAWLKRKKIYRLAVFPNPHV